MTMRCLSISRAPLFILLLFAFFDLNNVHAAILRRSLKDSTAEKNEPLATIGADIQKIKEHIDKVKTEQVSLHHKVVTARAHKEVHEKKRIGKLVETAVSSYDAQVRQAVGDSAEHRIRELFSGRRSKALATTSPNMYTFGNIFSFPFFFMLFLFFLNTCWICNRQKGLK